MKIITNDPPCNYCDKQRGGCKKTCKIYIRYREELNKLILKSKAERGKEKYG